jgi:hypothetical protein
MDETVPLSTYVDRANDALLSFKLVVPLRVEGILIHLPRGNMANKYSQLANAFHCERNPIALGLLHRSKTRETFVSTQWLTWCSN